MVCTYMVIGAVYALRIIGLADLFGQQSPPHDGKCNNETCCWEYEIPKTCALTPEGV